MDFRFTDEQQMIAEAMRSLLADCCRLADLRRLMRSGEARDSTRWKALTKMDLQGALVPKNKGGLGLACADLILVAEACGYAALPEPLIENAGISIPLLSALADLPLCRARLEQAIAGHITIALSHPVNPFIADGDTAGMILVANNDSLQLYEPDAVELVRQPSIDPFRRLFSIRTRADAAGTVRIGTKLLRDALGRGALFTAAQLVGIAQRAIDMAAAYAKDRNQFGKPIGSYQAVKHLLATAQVKIEFAKPVVYAASAQMEQADAFSRARISHAKLAAAEAADYACRTAIQVHGAMGYSWETDLHLFLKRTLALSSWWGDARFHRRCFASRAFSLPLGPEHTFSMEADQA